MTDNKLYMTTKLNTVLVILIVIIGGIACCCSSVKSYTDPPDDFVQMNQSIVGTNDPDKCRKEIEEVIKLIEEEGIPYGMEREFIELILKCMPELIYDISRDGKINCIDYSIIFRRLYGHNARIIINNNPKTGMNHMFIKAWIPSKGYYQYIEPQGAPDWYSMGVVWGTKYDPSYNKDVTDIWGM